MAEDNKRTTYNLAEISFSDSQWQIYLNQNISQDISIHNKITRNFCKIYGSIEGRLVFMSVAQHQKMGIRSSTDNKIIKCFFPDELLDVAKNALGKRVYAFGLIKQYLHGDKDNIQVEELKVFPDQTKSLSEILNFIRGAS